MLTKDDFVAGNVIAVPFAGRLDKARITAVHEAIGEVTMEIITDPDKGAIVTNPIDLYLTLGNQYGGYVDQGEANA